LVAGWLGRVDPLIFASIAASVAAGGMLVASVVRTGRRKRAPLAGQAPVLTPVGDRPPASARPGSQTWSGTVRTAPSSTPPPQDRRVPEEPAGEPLEMEETVEAVGGFLDDDAGVSQRDVFGDMSDIEDAELVDNGAPAGAASEAVSGAASGAASEAAEKSSR